MRRAIVLVALFGACSGSEKQPAPDFGADFAMAGDMARVADMANVDMATGGDAAMTPDMATTCGLPGQACCTTGTACDQDAAHQIPWFGAVCVSGVCQHCGSGGSTGGPGDGATNYCCAGANQCVSPEICTTTVNGPRCQ